MEVAEALKASGVDPSALEECISVDGAVILGFESSGQPPYKLWLELADKTPITGYFPVILEGGRDGFIHDFDLHLSSIDRHEQTGDRIGRSTQEILGRANEIDVAKFIDEHWEWLKEYWNWLNPELRRMKGWIKPRIKPKRIGMEQYMHIFLGEGERQIFDPDYFLLVPTQKSWELPAYLRFEDTGGHTPAEHCAVLRHWNRKFQSDVMRFGHDRLVLFVRNPPVTNQGAIDLALEHFAYDPDLIQNVGGLLDVANAVHGARLWSFWWD